MGLMELVLEELFERKLSLVARLFIDSTVYGDAAGKAVGIMTCG